MSLSEVLSEQIPKCSELAYSNLFLFSSFQFSLFFISDDKVIVYISMQIEGKSP